MKLEAQEREEIITPAGTFKTIRYEANVINGVIYARKGRAFIWATDDAERMPVEIRLRLAFPIGTVTLELEKQERPVTPVPSVALRLFAQPFAFPRSPRRRRLCSRTPRSIELCGRLTRIDGSRRRRDRRTYSARRRP